MHPLNSYFLVFVSILKDFATFQRLIDTLGNFNKTGLRVDHAQADFLDAGSDDFAVYFRE